MATGTAETEQHRGRLKEWRIAKLTNTYFEAIAFADPLSRSEIIDEFNSSVPGIARISASKLVRTSDGVAVHSKINTDDLREIRVALSPLSLDDLRDLDIRLGPLQKKAVEKKLDMIEVEIGTSEKSRALEVMSQFGDPYTTFGMLGLARNMLEVPNRNAVDFGRIASAVSAKHAESSDGALRLAAEMNRDAWSEYDDRRWATRMQHRRGSESLDQDP